MSGSRRRRLAARAAVVLQVVLLVAALVGPSRVVASEPSDDPSASATPTEQPAPTEEPSAEPTQEPTEAPTAEPTPTEAPSPSELPTTEPTTAPTGDPAPAGEPTIASDLEDYPPGGLVTLTGDGWRPKESVHIYVNDDWGSSWSRNVDVVADEDGRILDQFDLPNWFVAQYSVTATGAISGIARSSFTDSQPQSVTVEDTDVSVVAGDTAAFGEVEVRMVGNSNACTVTLGISGTLPPGASATFDPPAVTGNSTFTSTLDVSTTGATPEGVTTFRVSAARGSNCQGSGTVLSGTVTLRVAAAPTAAPRAESTDEDTAIVVTLTATDVATCQLTFATGSVTNGTVGPVTDAPCSPGTPNSDSATVTFTPSAHFNGTASFTYTASDGSLTSTPATVTVTVRPVNDPPTATNGNASTSEDQSVIVDLGAFASDVETADANLAYQIVAGPTSGTLSGTGQNRTYTPNANVSGSDSFTFRVTDRGDPDGCSPVAPNTCTAVLSSTIQTITINVSAVDDTPVAVADSATALEDSGANAIDVLANDTDIDGGPKQVESVTQPANGDVTITGGGTGVSYTPDADYCNVSPDTDDFTYTLNGGSSATVKVSVTCVDDAPVAADDSATVLEDSGANAIDVLANDTDIDGGPKQVESVTQGAKGAVLITNGGADLTYEPGADECGPDSFTYTLNGGSSATVEVTITCVSDAPAGSDGSATIDEDTSHTFAAADFGFSDPKDSPADTFVSVVITTLPGAGSLTLDASPVLAGDEIPVADLDDLVFTPVADANGTPYASFTFQVRDSGTTANGGVNLDPSANTFTINVTQVNDKPVLDPVGDQSGEEGTALTFDADAADVDGDTLTFSLAAGTTDCGLVTSCAIPSGASIDPVTGAFSWTPADDGTFRFFVVVTDDGTPVLDDREEITITVDNVAPTVTLLGTDGADEGDSKAYTYTWTDPGSADTFPAAGNAISCGANGTASLITFDPGAKSGGFTCTWSDDSGASTVIVSATVTDDDGGTHTVSIDVVVENVAPTATFVAPTSVDEGDTIDLALTDLDDPGTDDTHEYRFSCDDGATWSEWDTSNVSTCPTTDDGTVKVRGEVRDDDGGSNGYAKDVLVKNVAPTIALTGAGSTAEGSTYSLGLGAISDPGTDTVTQWIVDWGDGTAPEPFDSGGTKTHVYADGPASHTILVDLVDEDGTHEDAGTKSISVTNVAPTATFGAPTEVDEGSTINLSLASVVDPGTDTHEFRFSCDDGEDWTSWSATSTATCAAVDDGTVKVKGEVRDEDLDATTYSASVTVKNVAPTVPTVSITFDSVTHLAVATATYGDVGTADTHTAKFDWSVGSPASVTKAATGGSVADGRTLPNGCFTLSVTVTITDDDGGATSKTGTLAGSADAYAISFEAPIKDNERNVTKWGNVVPIKVRISSSCTGAAVTSPDLYLTVVKGSYDNIDEGTNVMATSVSAADTDNRMRLSGSGYIYNLSTKGFSAGSDYTVRVRLGGTDGTIVQSAVLQPKK